MYRAAASVLVLKKAVSPSGQDDFQVLLLHKPRKKDSWQLPQGGSEDGETIRETALRELKEEAGIENVRYLGASEHIYKYDFPASFRRFRPDNICGQKIHFVFALAPADIEIQVDGNEIDNHQWVFPREVRKHIKRKEYLRLVEQLMGEALRMVRGAGGPFDAAQGKQG
jgi:8-oxo-dGTP pyrophosphatase MutT (NUDIX family)